MTPESIVALDGVVQSISEHALDYGIPASLIIGRLHSGWDRREAIVTPMETEPGQKLDQNLTSRSVSRSPSNARRYTFNGKSLTIRQWSERTGLSMRIIDARIRTGWLIERVLTSPVDDRRCCRRGVGQNLAQGAKTGGVSFAHDRPELEFSE